MGKRKEEIWIISEISSSVAKSNNTMNMHLVPTPWHAPSQVLDIFSCEPHNSANLGGVFLVSSDGISERTEA